MRLNRPMDQSNIPYTLLTNNWKTQMMEKFKHVLDYDKNELYYLTFCYDLFRINSLYFIVWTLITQFNMASAIFLSFMICAILYILEKIIAQQLRLYFNRFNFEDDSVTLNLQTVEAPASVPPPTPKAKTYTIPRPPQSSNPYSTSSTLPQNYEFISFV